MEKIIERKSTWYWRIWWWFGYHGLYQINWWFKFWFTDRFTIAHDLSPFWRPGFNEREELDHVQGYWRAKLFCRKWVWKHPWGQARIIEGWKYWDEEKGDKNDRERIFKEL